MRKVKIQIPGKVIISGEHAVVQGCPAIAAACSVFLFAEFTPCLEKRFHIVSDQYGVDAEFDFNDLANLFEKNQNRYQKFLSGKLVVSDILSSPVELLAYALHLINKTYNLPHGGTFHFKSDLPPGAGMGSSAAAVTAIVKIINQHFNLSLCNEKIFQLVHECENLQHGKSSGLDPATIISNGLIFYRNGQFKPIPTPKLMNFYLVNTGLPQSTTGECVTAAKQYFDKELCRQFSKVTADVCQSLKSANKVKIKEKIRVNHQLLCQIGVVPAKVQEFAKDAKSELDAAVKISGAGSITGDSAGIAIVFSEKSPLLLCEKYGYSLLGQNLINSDLAGEL